MKRTLFAVALIGSVLLSIAAPAGAQTTQPSLGQLQAEISALKQQLAIKDAEIAKLKAELAKAKPPAAPAPAAIVQLKQAPASLAGARTLVGKRVVAEIFVRSIDASPKAGAFTVTYYASNATIEKENGVFTRIGCLIEMPEAQAMRLNKGDRFRVTGQVASVDQMEDQNSPPDKLIRYHLAAVQIVEDTSDDGSRSLNQQIQYSH